MALSAKALQKKREKKKKHRQLKVVKNTSTSPAISCSNWPVYQAHVPIELWETGIGQVLIARKSPAGQIITGVYLLDVWCLGVKDCFINVGDLISYEILLTQITSSCGEMELVEPSYANTLIHHLLAYSKNLGFQPHKDFAKAKHVLKNIPLDETLQFTFGQDGKPLYVQGPHDTPADVHRIRKTLEKTAGSDNYHYFVEAPS